MSGGSSEVGGCPDHRNPRGVLAQRRTSFKLDFRYANINATFTVGFSLYPAGRGDPLRCAEIFLNTDRSEGDLEANVRDAGILASYALQHGATIEQLVEGVTHEEDGSCSSLVGLALNLVAREIDRMRRGDADAAAGDGPGGPSSPAGTGGAVADPAAGPKDVAQTLNRKAGGGQGGDRASAGQVVHIEENERESFWRHVVSKYWRRRYAAENASCPSGGGRE